MAESCPGTTYAKPHGWAGHIRDEILFNGIGELANAQLKTTFR